MSIITRRISGLVLLSLVIVMAACSSQRETTRKEDEPDLKQAAQLNVQLAVGYIKRNQLEAAKEKLEKAIEQDNENLDAHKTLAYLLSRLGMNDDADDQYQEAIRIKSGDPDLHNSYGTFLCKLERVDEALDEFKAAYSHPFYETPYIAYANAGTCLLKKEDYAQAESMLRKALRKDPDLAGALLSMAELGVRTKKYLMARAYAQRYHVKNKASAESLWIAVQAEKALGAKDFYIKYAKQLIADFPDSDEAGWAEEQARNEPLRSN